MLRQRCLTLTDPSDDVLATDPARPCRRHPRRAVPRRAGRAARRRRRRLREAPADDRPAIRDGLHHREPGQPRFPGSQAARAPGRSDNARSLDDRDRVLLSVSDRLSAVGDGILFQYVPRPEACALRLSRPLHSVEPVQLACQQHRSGGRAVLGHVRGRPDRDRTKTGVAGCAQDRDRDDRAGDALRRPADALRHLRALGQRCRHAAPRAGRTDRGVPDHLRRHLAARVRVGDPRPGGGVDADSVP